MKVLIDTSIWSIALRRNQTKLSEAQRKLGTEWHDLVTEGRAVLVGPVLQEILSGVRDHGQFEALRKKLSVFSCLIPEHQSYVEAARYSNLCRAEGIACSAIDALICSLASRFELAIFTTDADFDRYARLLPIRLHQPRCQTKTGR